MGFRQGAYATVWEVKEGKGNYSDVRLSISKKKGEVYETDFSGFVRFIGEAHKKAPYLGEKQRIKLGECDVTNRYNKEEKKTYTSYAVFDFEDANSNNEGTTEPAPVDSNGFMAYPDDDDMPFK